MPELRKDYVLNNFVIIATERAKRPDQFISEKKDKKTDICHFCPGNESLTPGEHARITDGKGGWLIRCFTNMYAAVAPTGNYIIKTDNSFFTYSDGFGLHEVIVETPEHEKELWDLPTWHIEKLLRFYSYRIQKMEVQTGIKYVTVFKNSGSDAGTSILHTHSQLIGYNLIPEEIIEKEKASANSCPYCRIIEIEKNSDRRCFESYHSISFTPYASRFPFEIWLFPRRHIRSITDFNDDEYKDTAEMLIRILSKLKKLNAPYNMYLQYGLDKMHFHIVITPRLAKWAGFEISTGTIINTMPPEKAAEFYRE
ncbi:MAG: DUF4931 domain-containing protein [archaeon]